jgi:hypothetical protein
MSLTQKKSGTRTGSLTLVTSYFIINKVLIFSHLTTFFVDHSYPGVCRPNMPSSQRHFITCTTG